jgi:hypothetical protein
MIVQPSIYKKNRTKENKTQTQKTKWAKFTCTGRETMFITKLFKPFNVDIAFTTKHNIGTLLREDNDNPYNKYNRSGVYQLTFFNLTENIWTNWRPFHVQYKERARIQTWQ